MSAPCAPGVCIAPDDSKARTRAFFIAETTLGWHIASHRRHPERSARGAPASWGAAFARRQVSPYGRAAVPITPRDT